MNNYEVEKVIYLTGLIVALAALASIFGLPSVAGVTLFLIGMVLTWRLGVIVDQTPPCYYIEEETDEVHSCH